MSDSNVTIMVGSDVTDDPRANARRLMRAFNKYRRQAMNGKVTSTEYNENQTAVCVTVTLYDDDDALQQLLEFELEPDKAKRFPVGTLVELGIKVKRV